jgi:hypothetical protein
VTGVSDPDALPPILPPDAVIDPAFWNRAANAAVRAYCGWHVAPVITETLTLDGNGGTMLLLPTQRIVDVVSAFIGDTEVTEDLRFSERSGVIGLGLGYGYWTSNPRTWEGWGYPSWQGGLCVFPNVLGILTITMTHGYDLEDVPNVAEVIASVQARAQNVPAGVVMQAVGPASVRYAENSAGASYSGQATPLMSTEIGMLAPYKLNWGV